MRSAPHRRGAVRRGELSGVKVQAKLLPGLVPEALLVALACGTWWAIRGLMLPSDVGWQIWIARQMLGGTEVYTEIWEVNPPLWFWSAMPVAWAAELTAAGWVAAVAAVVVALAVLAAWLFAALLDIRRPAERLAVMVLVFAMTAILPMVMTGQREQLALIGSLPYAALIARRAGGQAVPLAMAAGVAVMAAYGFALKHYFVAVPVALELWLIARLRARWRPWRPELAVLAGCAAAYVTATLVLAPGFLGEMVPMVTAAYRASQATLFFTAVKPYVLFWVLAGLYLLVTRRHPLRPASPAAEAAFGALLAVWAGFALGYFLQNRGWNYHSIAATGAMGVAVGLRLVRMRPGADLVIGAALVAAPVLLMYPYSPVRTPEDPWLDRVPDGEGVFVADFDASSVWRENRAGLVWVSRAYSLWMVQAIAEAEAGGRTPPALARVAAQVLAATSQDIRCHPPRLVLMKATPGVEGKGGAFSFDEFLRRDPALRRFLAEHYTPPQQVAAGTVYWRRGEVAPTAEPGCRIIR